MAKQKATTGELEARAESNGYKRGRTERKTAIEVFDSKLTSDCPGFEFADRATILEFEANIHKRERQPNSPDPFVRSSTDTYMDFDTLYSNYLRSRSSSIPISETQDCNAEPTIGLFDRTSA
jgi:hypothetical protein